MFSLPDCWSQGWSSPALGLLTVTLDPDLQNTPLDFPGTHLQTKLGLHPSHMKSIPQDLMERYRHPVGSASSRVLRPQEEAEAW